MLECLLNLPWHQIIMKGVITSLIASFLFLSFLYILRPRIKIAPKIAKNGDKYILKTINRSFFRLYDVKFQLTLKHYFGGSGGRNVKYTRIKLKNNVKLTYPKRPFWKPKDEYFEHAVIISIDEDIQKIWSNESDELEFIVIAKHGLSNFAKIKKQVYCAVGTDIEEGTYTHGNNFKIIDS